MRLFRAEPGWRVVAAVWMATMTWGAEDSPVRRIRADTTRLDRVAGLVHFMGNVRIELRHGRAECPRASMDERAGIVRCFDGVHAVLVSTADGSSVEVRSRHAAYDMSGRVLEFSGDPEAVHLTSAGVPGMRCSAARMTLDERARTVTGEGVVRLDADAGRLECGRMVWVLDSGEVRASSQESPVRYIATMEESPVRSCVAGEAHFDVGRDRLRLIGGVEVVF